MDIVTQTHRVSLESRFRVIKVLGQGAGSKVLKAVDLRSNSLVALKLLSDPSAFDEHTIERFQREFEACSHIKHPNIVQAYEAFKFQEGLAFSMEHVDGHDLAKTLGARPLTFAEIDKIFAQMLTALAELHKNSIIHRDVKLENILLREDGAVKITDLGLLKRGSANSLTETGILLGTSQYMPPEYVQSGLFEPRGDLYSAGLVLYEMLKRERFLAGKDAVHALQHLIETHFEMPDFREMKVPYKYIYVLEHSVTKKPGQRFRTANEMLDVFSNLRLEDGPSSYIKPDRPGPSILSPGFGMKIHDHAVARERRLQRRVFYETVLAICLVAFAGLLCLDTVRPDLTWNSKQVAMDFAKSTTLKVGRIFESR